MPDGFPIACAYSVDINGNIGDTCASNPAELSNTNNKVIVSRDYTGFGGGDMDGHGTGVAMIAAGLTNNAAYDLLLSDGVTILPIPLNPITGVAPGAWLGAYKVVGPDGGSTVGILRAAEDAVNDGMQVLNLSLGSASLYSEDESGGAVPEAISTAVAAGVAVVIAAGNDGSSAFDEQQPSTISFPAVAADAITVGAIGNGRMFDYSVTVSGMAPVEAGLPDVSVDFNLPDLIDPLNGPLFDVTTVDPTGLACTTLPANSLNRQIALIFRGSCTFDIKLINAAEAGAIGAVMVDNRQEHPFNMYLTAASIPALLVDQNSGLNMQAAADAGGATAYLDFGAITPFAANPQTIAYYSSSGPTQAGNIKPDLMAVGGQPINSINDTALIDDGLAPYSYTGAQVLTALSTVVAAEEGLTDAYQIASGTSFATPFVAGSIAVLMAARPGLTVPQYKSLVVNSAPQLIVCDDYSPPDSGICNDGSTPLAPLIQNVGSGSLDLFGAYQNNLAAVPASINFQTASGSVNSTIPVSVTNVGAAADSFTVVVNPLDGTLTPTVDTATFQLAPGQTQIVNVTVAATNLQPGTYHDGNIVITGTQTPIATSLAYWFGVPGTTVYDIVLLNQNQLNGGAAPRQEVAIYVRYTDAIGMPIAGATPTVTVPGTAGRVISIVPAGDIPGTWMIVVRLDSGLAEGGDEFDITVGTLQPPLQVFIPIVSN